MAGFGQLAAKVMPEDSKVGFVALDVENAKFDVPLHSLTALVAASAVTSAVVLALKIKPIAGDAEVEYIPTALPTICIFLFCQTKHTPYGCLRTDEKRNEMNTKDHTIGIQQPF